MTAATRTALLASLLLFHPAAAMAGGSMEPVCGDVNDSGTVNTSDALLVLRKGVGQQVTLDCSAYDGQYETCQSLLSTANSNLEACNADLSSTNADLTACSTGSKCGDGVVNSVGEHCDDEDLGDADCQSLGYNVGTLHCDETCKFDTSSCDRCPEGSNLFNGACWLLGALPLNEDVVGSCDVACASVGLECDEPALQMVGSGGTDEACRAAADAAEPEGAPYVVSPVGTVDSTGCGTPEDYAFGCALARGLEPEVNGTIRFLYEGSGTRCSADYYGGFCATPTLRVCACKP